MKRWGIRKTKMNIFWLLVIGVLVGLVIGLRQQTPDTATSQFSLIQEVKK